MKIPRRWFRRQIGLQPRVDRDGKTKPAGIRATPLKVRPSSSERAITPRPMLPRIVGFRTVGGGGRTGERIIRGGLERIGRRAMVGEKRMA